jgi:hypothetical protein
MNRKKRGFQLRKCKTEKNVGERLQGFENSLGPNAKVPFSFSFSEKNDQIG